MNRDVVVLPSTEIPDIQKFEHLGWYISRFDENS